MHVNLLHRTIVSVPAKQSGSTKARKCVGRIQFGSCSFFTLPRNSPAAVAFRLLGKVDLLYPSPQSQNGDEALGSSLQDQVEGSLCDALTGLKTCFVNDHFLQPFFTCLSPESLAGFLR